MAFQWAYAIGLLVMGGLVDRIGTRLGYAFAITIWSIAAMAHALVRTAFGFGVARFALGLGESGNFPAAVKTVAEWFPRRERALATGIFNSGTNIGATVAPLVVPWIAVHWGWQFAFLFTGLFSAIWVACWLTIYRKPQDHPRVSAAELNYIQSEPIEPTEKIAWLSLLAHPQTWAFVMGKFITDPVWWFFLFWLPKFLASEHKLTLTGLGLPLIVIYNAATLGSVFGGLLPAKFLKRGWGPNRARKTTMLLCALAVVPIMIASRVQNLWGAVALISLATAAHQGWSANLFTLPSDMFPRRAVASVVGMGSCGGAIGGALVAGFVGFLLQHAHNYLPVFVMAGLAYLFALMVIQLLAPRLQPANIQ